MYINEGLTQLKENLARKVGTIVDSWTIYGKIMVKDLYGYAKKFSNEQELKARLTNKISLYQ